MTIRSALAAGAALARILMACAAIAAGTTFAFLQIFAQFQVYDDEGYIMASVRTFLDGLPLYDRTFTQYGPFYYAFMGLVYKVSRVPVGHDATRIITIVFWIATAVLLGLFVFRVTRSFSLALLVYLQAVIHSTGLIGEPGHPQGLLILLLAGMLVSATLRRPAAPIAMGVIGACLLLTKINVGLFAVAAAAIALLALAPASRLWRAALCLVAAGFAVLPFALMRTNLSAWAWAYAVLAACAIAAASVAAWRVGVSDPADRPIVQFAAATAGMVLLVIAGTLVSGTSIRGLVEGIVLAPLRFGSVFTMPWVIPRVAVWYGAGGLALAIAAAVAPRTSALVVYAGAAAGIAFAGLIMRAPMHDQISLALVAPLVWVLLLPVEPAGSDWTGLLPRALLCLLAAGQVLVAYPVAGNQQAWATLLLLPAAAVALNDGLMRLPPFRVAWIRAAAEIAMLAAVLTHYYPIYQTDQLRERYRIYASLDLPHAGLIRLPRAEKRTYREIVTAIRADCDTFVPMPGLGSFYFWTEKPPLTGFNATAWMTLFDDRTQRQIVDRLAEHPSACVLTHEGLVRAWAGARPIDDRPLVKYIRTAFHPVKTFGEYQLLFRNDRPDLPR